MANSSASFATFMIICPVSFFLGMIFALFPYDYPLLWVSDPISVTHLDQLEAHLRLLHNSPNLIVRMMHIITAVGFLGIIWKLYKPTESNMLFDGGSLVLYVIAVMIYVVNIVKGLRMVSVGKYGEGIENMSQDYLDNVDLNLGVEAETGNEVLGREDNLRVFSASNTILALVLVGILALQFGQWYAERAEAKERIAIAKRAREREEKEAAGGAAAASSGSSPGGRKEAKGGKGTKKTN